MLFNSLYDYFPYSVEIMTMNHYTLLLLIGKTWYKIRDIQYNKWCILFLRFFLYPIYIYIYNKINLINFYDVCSHDNSKTNSLRKVGTPRWKYMLIFICITKYIENDNKNKTKSGYTFTELLVTAINLIGYF